MRYEYRYERYSLDRGAPPFDNEYEIQALLDEMGRATWRVHTFVKDFNRPFLYFVLYEREIEL